MTKEAAQFVEEMLRRIRHEFFARLPEKQFYQERLMLIRAITWPDVWMDRRGVKAPISTCRRILGIVVGAIKQHGNQVKYRRFSLYLFKAVQEHMNHHGEQYYYEAKVRPAAAVVPDVMSLMSRSTRSPEVAAVQDLARISRLLKSPGGRRRRRDSGKGQLQLASLSPLRTDKRRQPA